MAKDTPDFCKNLILYEIYVRNHGPNGTFFDVEADLERIRSMGVDVIWFMPIHPIGQLNKKGSLGCPYSIADYRDVNPEYGTKEDFSRLIQKAHALGLKVMIDVVYNHTAHDSVLVKAHPDYYHQDASGHPMTTVPDWSDVIDLKHPNPDLTRYLIDTLIGWVEFGVDGFRCDVASLLPQDFWVQAREEVAQVKPGVIWLAESVHAGFVSHRRDHNLPTLSDSEVYAGFDLTYDYDIWPLFQQAVLGKIPVKRYLEALRFQDAIYPLRFVKMRCVENHDQARIMRIAPTRNQAIAWTAFSVFNKGAWLIYGGEESAADHTPSLFDIDKVDWKDYSLQPLFTKLIALKKDILFQNGILTFVETEPAIQAVWQDGSGGYYGIFNVTGISAPVQTHLPDGDYQDVISGEHIAVKAGQIPAPAAAVILKFVGVINQRPFFSELLDFNLHAS